MKKICIITLVIFVFVPLVAHADLGPKPSMDFSFRFENEQNLTIISGQQIVCEQADCSDGKPLAKIGPQGFRCTDTDCSSLAYGYPGEYNQLVIKFSDGKVRASNIFRNTRFASYFEVVVTSNALRIGTTDSFIQQRKIPGWIVALVITAFIELLVVFVWNMKKKVDVASMKRWLVVVLLMNCVTLPSMWFFLYRITGGITLLIVFEIAVLCVETIILYAFIKPKPSLKKAFLVSFVLNAASFIVGGALLSQLLSSIDLVVLTSF